MSTNPLFLLIAFLTLLGSTTIAKAQTKPEPRLIPIADGWARNQINAVIFRRNSVTTHNNTQYAAFYDSDSRVVLAKRALGSTKWQIRVTQLKGNTSDAHNSISIAVDGDGFLHLAWNHHNSSLLYSRSVSPGSLETGPTQVMIGNTEDRVTYPEFYNLPGGDLLVLYRDGASGNGNLILNRYYVRTKQWRRLQDNLISGEGQRNAYWQMAVGPKGEIHLSWVWRETPDVATNHDLCYAKSIDGGKTWQSSTGQQYTLPITAATAEYVWRIPQKSELINQTSMTVDRKGRPYIASYWRRAGDSVPQYFVVFQNGKSWSTSQVTRRTSAFSLSGGGTRRIPISRPQILVTSNGATYVLFRDKERGERVSVAISEDLTSGNWRTKDLTKDSVGMWEPTLDHTLWMRKNVIHLLVQKVGQGEAETLDNTPAQMVSVLEWVP